LAEDFFTVGRAREETFADFRDAVHRRKWPNAPIREFTVTLNAIPGDAYNSGLPSGA
jgi:hypothetical protein